MLGLSVNSSQPGIYGEALSLEGAPTPLESLMSDFEQFDKKTVIVSGRVKKVCQKKGCWMVIESPKKQTVRVLFKDYAFTVPQNILNKSALIQGVITQKLINTKEQRHFLSDEGAPTSQLKAKLKPKKVFRFIASGVEVK